MIMSIRANSRTPQLISRSPKVYSRILTSMTLKKLNMVIIEEQIQDMTIELPLKVRQ